ncbi:uncharacterized protein LOC132941425 isoform X2 [Metopolophium dirhodum]|uniref:uncharacterized protein LOC132941425 isoform X2 n=1 Tax=Metopolophium dirhodum TaxID=44670 RepID=UPI00298FF324|nr:uncharacterized protein LOC132941425 isoform X2 [Metopolophium dirhodum]
MTKNNCYNNDISIKVSSAILLAIKFIPKDVICNSTGTITLNNESISLILKCFGHHHIDVGKYFNEVCVIQNNILDKRILTFKLDDDIFNLFQFVITNPFIKDMNHLAKHYISKQPKFKKKNKNIKKFAIQDIKNKLNSVQMNHLLQLYEMHNYPDKNIDCDQINIVYKSSKKIEHMMGLLNSNKLPLGFLNYINTHSIHNKNDLKKMIECMLTNFNTNDQFNKFAFNESDGIQYCLNGFKNVLMLHIECCKLQKLIRFINILNKYKNSVIVKNGIIYYNVIKRCFFDFKYQFKYFDQYLCLDENYEFDLTCKNDEACIINNKILSIPQATQFESEHLTYSDAVVMTFLYIYITNTALSHSTMRNICDSFELVMNIIMKNDTYDNSKSFLKHTIEKFEKLNIITKNQDFSHSAYKYKIKCIHPITESIIFNYRLRNDNYILENLHKLKKDDVNVYAHIYKKNTKMFNLNITQYHNDDTNVVKKIICDNRLTKRIHIMESAIINIIKNNFKTEYTNIHDYYHYKMNELQKESRNDITKDSKPQTKRLDTTCFYGLTTLDLFEKQQEELHEIKI